MVSHLLNTSCPTDFFLSCIQCERFLYLDGMLLKKKRTTLPMVDTHCSLLTSMWGESDDIKPTLE